MNEDRVVALRQEGEIDDPLTEILRAGANRLIAQAVEAEWREDIVQALFDLWERELPRISGKSKLAEAIRYARLHRVVLRLFLDDGRIKIDSNIVERAIRPQAITRKNSLFANRRPMYGATIRMRRARQSG